MDIAGDKIIEYSTEQSFQRIAENMADILIKTPGNPEHWENNRCLATITPGLADFQNGTNRFGNILNMKKISYLKDNPMLIKKLLPLGMECSLSIYPTNTSQSIIEVINDKIPSGDVCVVNRTVLYDYGLIDICSNINPNEFYGNGSKYVCTHAHMNYYKHECPDFNNRKSGWLCNAFNLDLEDINSKDYYLLTDPHNLIYNSDFQSCWIIDTPNNTTYNSHNFTSNPIIINSFFSKLSGNNSREIFVLHVFTNGDIEKTFNTYIVGVPKGTPINDVRIENIKPQSAFFILKLWMN
jgi:hypothetical protein